MIESDFLQSCFFQDLYNSLVQHGKTSRALRRKLFHKVLILEEVADDSVSLKASFAADALFLFLDTLVFPIHLLLTLSAFLFNLSFSWVDGV